MTTKAKRKMNDKIIDEKLPKKKKIKVKIAKSSKKTRAKMFADDS
jgi:hypothetical protein